MHQGSCLCGGVRFEIESDLKAVVNCHCQFCHKAHGAAFTTLAFMPFAHLKILEGDALISRYHIESLNADRCFCARCGTRLFNHAPAVHMVSVVVATLAGTDTVRPRAHINTESKCGWYVINDHLPQFPAMPPPAEFEK
jgi:hypothetical protein